MIDSFFNTAIGHILHLVSWSTMLTLVVMGCIRLNPKLQYWSALWKVSLLLCLLPLFPWSYIELSMIEHPVVQQLVPELPKVWFTNGALMFSSHQGAEAQASETAMLHLIVLITSSILIVSLLKVLVFIYKLAQFNRSLKDHELLDNSASMLAFLTAQQKAFIDAKRIDILLASGSMSPFATGIFRPRIVLPTSFFILPTAQQTLLMEHEITHIKRRDLDWLMLTQLAKCLFWFTPAVYVIKSKLALSIEVECDQTVLGVFPNMKKDYGRALINIVRHTQQPVTPQAVCFISQQFSDLKNRITFTQQPKFEQGKSVMNKITLTLAVMLFSAASWALNTNTQHFMSVDEFLTLHKHASRYIEDNHGAFDTSDTWINPVKTSWVSSSFKMKQKIRYYKPHLGIDLAAKRGAEIVAANKGVVIIADNVSLNKNHGNVVVIDHGEGTLSMYSHMGSFDVKKGDTVATGQLLGKVGMTGKTTGPHLHFEMITANRHIDPALVIEFNYK